MPEMFRGKVERGRMINKMKILNLFAGIGGNARAFRKTDEVTSIENIQEIGKIYEKFFYNHKVIVTDAYDYLEKNHQNYDFIWASPPCPTHSKLNLIWKKIPDMRLYGLIVFLNNIVKKPFVVENVIPFYEPLIKPTVLIGRHYFWSNYPIKKKKFDLKNIKPPRVI